MPISIDRLVRSRRKTIALIVQPDGSLVVRAPLHLSEDHIREFVESHADWIRRNQEKARKHAPPPPRRFAEGEEFYYLGQSYPLRLVPRQRPLLSFDGAAFHLARLAQAKASPVFVRWYKSRALEVLTERVRVLAEEHHFAYQKIRISSARTRWGSCSSKGTLSFTYRLVMAPPPVIDYVVLHELVHTQVRNHSNKFWSRVAALMPNYKQHVVWLRKNGRFLA